MREALVTILAFAEAESARLGLTIHEHLQLQQAAVDAFTRAAAEAQQEWNDKQEGFA